MVDKVPETEIQDEELSEIERQALAVLTSTSTMAGRSDKGE